MSPATHMFSETRSSRRIICSIVISKQIDSLFFTAAIIVLDHTMVGNSTMTTNGEQQVRQNPDRESYRDFIGCYYKQLLHPDSYAKLQRVVATLAEPAYIALLEHYNENIRKNFQTLRAMEPVTPEKTFCWYAKAKIEFYSLRFIIEMDKLSTYQFQEESGYGSKSMNENTMTKKNLAEQNTTTLIKILFFHALTSKSTSANLALVELEQLCSRRQLTLNALYQKYRTKLLKLIIEALLLKLTTNENQQPQINGTVSQSNARYVQVGMGRALQVFNMVKLSSDEIAESLIIITNLVNKRKYNDDAFRQILKYLKYINTDLSFLLRTHIHQIFVALLLKKKMSYAEIKSSINKLCELCDTNPKIILTGRFELIKSRLLLQYSADIKTVTDAMCFVAQLELKEDEQPFDEEFDEKDKFMGYVNRCLVGTLLSVDAHFTENEKDLGNKETLQQIESLCKILTMLTKDQVKSSHVKLLSTLSLLLRLRPRRDDKFLNIAIKDLWRVFVSKLDDELRASLILNICGAMYELIEDCPDEVSSIYQDLICHDRAKKNADKFKCLFFIPDVPAMRGVYSFLTPHVRRSDTVNNIQELSSSIDCVIPLLQLESQRCRIIGLTKIRQLLQVNRVLLASTMLTNLDEPLNEIISKTIERLISMSSTQSVEHAPLIAECLGILGAVNPIRMDQLIYGGISNESLIVTDLSDSNFVAALIERLKNALFSDQVSESEVASYALQAVVEKLKVLESKNIVSKLSKEALKACELCRTTNYCATRKDSPKTSQAVYESLRATKQHSYREWLDKFSLNIINSIPDKVIQEVLTACTYLFKCNLKLAEFLVPHIVIYLIMKNSNQLPYVRLEILSIIDENIGLSSQDLENVYSDDIKGGAQALHYQCANMVFCIMDAIERLDILSDKSTKESAKLVPKQLQGVKRTLNEIPKDKLALLASRCRSHARALRYFEDFLYQSQSKAMFDKHATSLQKIHIALDDTFDAAGIQMVRNSPTTLVDDISNHEACGRFDRAFVCCATSLDAIGTDADSESLIENSLQCLSQQGDYHRLLEKTRQFIHDFPQFKRDLLPHAIEAEWKLGRWDDLDRTLGIENYDSLLESASVSQGLLLNVTNICPEDIPKSLNIVRQRLMRPLSVAMMDRSAYFRGYQSLLILHSIEDFALSSDLFAHEMLQTQKGDENVVDINRSKILKRFDSILDSWVKRSKLVEPNLKSYEPILAWQRSICMSLERRFPLLSSRIKVDIGQSWLTSSGFCREARSFDRSFYSLVQAQRWFGSDFDHLDLDLRVKYHIEQAQLDWDQGDKTKAIRSLRLSLDRLKNHKLHEHLRLRISKPAPSSDPFPQLNNLEPCKGCENFTTIERESFARLKRLLTQYCEEAAAEIPENLFYMYEECVHLGVDQEETYFRLARYYDKLLAYYVENPKLCSRQELSETQRFSQGLMTGNPEEVYTKLMEHSIIAFGNSLKYGARYLRESMPRLLNIWYDLGSKIHKGMPSSTARNINSKISSTVKFIDELKTRHLPPYYFMTAISLLLSRVTHIHSNISLKTCEIIELLLSTYPHQLSWQMQALFNEETNTDRKKIAKQFKDKIAKQFPTVDKIVKDTSIFSKVLQDICYNYSPSNKKCDEKDRLAHGIHDIRSVNPYATKLNLQQLRVIAPIQASLRAILPMSNANLRNHDVFPAKHTSFIHSFFKDVRIFNSVQRPKQVTLRCDNGKTVNLLCKAGDDLRKDSRCTEFLDLLNRILRRDNLSNARFFDIQAFLVLVLKPDSALGIIEMVPNCNSLKNTFETLYRQGNPNFSIYNVFPKPAKGKELTAAEKQKLFVSDIIPKVSPPVLPVWFRRTFTEPTSWYMARLAFTRTTAVISMGGYIIGLGDRHLDNILIDVSDGRIVHVDFNLLFHQGETLPVPEIVPFRLTHNIVAGFGSLGTEGNFRKVCEIVMRVMRKEKDALLTTLKPFMHDPCSDWTKKRDFKGKNNKDDIEERFGENKSAKYRIEVVERKLKGFPRSHNFKPLTLIDSYSVEAQVDNLIMEATDTNNLALMYQGWAPHI